MLSQVLIVPFETMATIYWSQSNRDRQHLPLRSMMNVLLVFLDKHYKIIFSRSMVFTSVIILNWRQERQNSPFCWAWKWRANEMESNEKTVWGYGNYKGKIQISGTEVISGRLGLSERKLQIIDLTWKTVRSLL